MMSMTPFAALDRAIVEVTSIWEFDGVYFASLLIKR